MRAAEAAGATTREVVKPEAIDGRDAAARVAQSTSLEVDLPSALGVAVARHDAEQLRTVPPRKARPDAGDTKQRAFVVRRLGGHSEERSIVHDAKCGQPGFPRLREPPRAERLEEGGRAVASVRRRGAASQ